MKHALAVLLLCFGTVAHADLAEGLLAHYPFNANANDESGRGHNGVVFGAQLVADRFGKPNSAYLFNGTDSYIVATITNLPAGAAPRTMTAWMLIPNPEPGQLSAVGYGAGNNNQQFGLGGNGATPYFWEGITDWQPALPPQPLGKWFFEAVTYSNGFVSVWLNASNALHNATLNTVNNGKFFIGATSENGNTPSGPPGTWKVFFAGALDDVRLYDRALTDDEIRQIYALENPPPLPFLDIKVSKVIVTEHVIVGRKYFLESSVDLNTWSPAGDQFTAQSEVINAEFDVSETGRWFRIREVP